MNYTPRYCPSCGLPTHFAHHVIAAIHSIPLSQGSNAMKGWARCTKGHRHPATIINHYNDKGEWKRRMQGTHTVTLPLPTRIQQWFFAANHSIVNYLGRFF